MSKKRLDSDRLPFPNRLRDARRRKGLTQEQLAHRIDTAQHGISYYESGRRMPTVKILRRLALELEVSADYLIGL